MQLKERDRFAQALDGHRSDVVHPDKSFDQPQGGGGQRDATRGGELLHARGQVGRRPDGGVVHVQVVADGPDHDFPGVQPHPDAQRQAMGAAHHLRVALHRRLHGQGGIAGPRGMVFMGQGGAEQSHDAVPQDLIHRALEAVHRVHHELDGRVEELLGRFGVEVLDQLGGVLDVGEQHGHVLALPFQGAPGREDPVRKMVRGV